MTLPVIIADIYALKNNIPMLIKEIKNLKK